jgi:DNA polymerase-3 subunit epsilon
MAQLNSPDELFDLGLQTTNTLQSTEALGQSTRTDDSLATINFDLDIYFILVRFLIDDKRMKMNNIKIWPLTVVPTDPF